MKIGILSLALGLGMVAVAQNESSAAQSFEVASIKPSPVSGGGVRGQSNDPTHFSARSSTLKVLIRRAYDLQDYQLEGGPSWTETERYDIDAKTGSPSSNEEMLMMLRSLLLGRFGLVLNHRTKQMTVNVLSVAPGGPNWGPHFRKLQDGEISATPKPVVDILPFANITMKTLCYYLKLNLARDLATGQLTNPASIPPVIDHTNLDGKFDILLKMKGEEDWGQILKKQLGLQVALEKAPVDITVIDAATKPLAN